MGKTHQSDEHHHPYNGHLIIFITCAIKLVIYIEIKYNVCTCSSAVNNLVYQISISACVCAVHERLVASGLVSYSYIETLKRKYYSNM